MGLTKFEDGIRQWPTDGLGGGNIYHRRRLLSSSDCQHSRMQVVSQAAWTRPRQGSDPSALEPTSKISKPHSRSAGAYDSLTTAAGKHGAHTQNLKLGSGSALLTGSAGRISTTVGASSVGANCQHSRMQVDSQVAWI